MLSALYAIICQSLCLSVKWVDYAKAVEDRIPKFCHMVAHSSSFSG